MICLSQIVGTVILFPIPLVATVTADLCMLLLLLRVDVVDLVAVVLLLEDVPLDGRDDVSERVDGRRLVVVDVVAVVVLRRVYQLRRCEVYQGRNDD